MLRKRLAALALAAGLCGCTSLANHPWFNHGATPVAGCSGCLDAGGIPLVTEGPVLGDAAPVVVAPPGAVPGNGNGGLVPQPTTVPPLTAPPRITPVPAQPIPYNP